jgi:hypothetical protein
MDLGSGKRGRWPVLVHQLSKEQARRVALRAGYLAPRAGAGSGLWVARQLTWLIEFFRSPDGFTTRTWF